MITLNLAAMTADQIVMKDYLENNVSEALAEKINNGVRIEKDGKTLINKKTLENFIDTYAYEQAKKQVKQGAQGVGIYRDAIFNWLITYFEEDSIIGILYNEDGTEYKPPAPKYTSPAPKAATTKAKSSSEPSLKKVSMFDMMNEQKLEDFKIDEPEQAKPPEAECKPVQPEADENASVECELESIKRIAAASDGRIIVASMPPLPESEETPQDAVPISSTRSVDPKDGVVYEVANADLMALERIFGSALKIEVA